MTNILSQEEIDAIIGLMGDQEAEEGGQVEKPGAEGESPRPTTTTKSTAGSPAAIPRVSGPPAEKRGSSKYKYYDFRRPEKFSKNQARMLKSRMDIIARQIANMLSNLLVVNFELSVLDVSQCNYGDFFRVESLESILVTFRIADNRPDHGVFQFSTRMAFMIIERLMGGTGSSKQPLRELTEFEQVMLTDVFNRILEIYTKALKDYSSINGKIIQVENEPTLIQKVFSPEETFIKSTYEIRFQEVKEFMIISIPYFLLSSAFSTSGRREEKEVDNRQKVPLVMESVPRNLRDMKFTLEVNLGNAMFTVRELLELVPGSIIVLDKNSDELLEVCINQRPRFRAKPGLKNGKMGAMITSIIVEGQDEDE